MENIFTGCFSWYSTTFSKLLLEFSLILNQFENYYMIMILKKIRFSHRFEVFNVCCGRRLIFMPDAKPLYRDDIIVSTVKINMCNTCQSAVLKPTGTGKK